ncbi:unnamed protein product [Pieris macdunnoughi]|uniref:Uncharacterized protein n=1 Tax=Pieris macdunnoughi TaxID=345717 RepID=A0A821LZE5_9NEOP|nr:unnamed protein product [Pieris macdunnoughi]
MDRKRGEGSPDPQGSGAQVPGGAGLVGSRCRVAVGRNAFADVKSDLRCRRGLYLSKRLVGRMVSLHCVWAHCARAALYEAPPSRRHRSRSTSCLSRIYS